MNSSGRMRSGSGAAKNRRPNTIGSSTSQNPMPMPKKSHDTAS